MFMEMKTKVSLDTRKDHAANRTPFFEDIVYTGVIMAVIDAPEFPPLLFNRNGKYTYVCSCENMWDSERHMSVRVKGKTMTVGKIVGGELTGTIEWAEKFLSQYPILEKLKTTREEERTV